MNLRNAAVRLLSSALALIACLVPSVASAAWPYSLMSGNVPVCTATGAQSGPVIVPDGVGGTILVWTDARGGTTDIYAQRVNASGVTQWTANGVAVCTAANDQNSVSAEPDGSGGVFIAWSDARVSATPDIYAQRLNASGVAQWAANGVVVCNAAGNQYVPVLVADGAGGVIVTWYDKRTGVNYDVYSQRLNGSGTPQWTGGGVVVCGATGDQYAPRACTDGAGGVIVTWYDGRSGTNFDIFAQRVTAAGTAAWFANGIAMGANSSEQLYPVIVSNGTGGAFISWQELGVNARDIWMNQVNSAGTLSVTYPGYQLTYHPGDQIAPTLVTDGAGGAIVGWTDRRSGVNNSVYAQHVSSANALTWTDGGVLLSDSPGEHNTPSLTTDGAGGVIAAWSYWKTSTYDYNVLAQWLNASGVAQWGSAGVPLSNAPGHTYGSGIASDGLGGAVVAITDTRSGPGDIYAQRVDRFGQIGSAEPALLSAKDVANDQGGKVKLTWTASFLDAFPSYAIGSYLVWRAVPSASAQAALASGARLVAEDERAGMSTGRSYRTSTFGAQVIYWEYLATLPGDGLPGYSYLAATASDSIEGANPLTKFQIEARAATGIGRWYSSPDSAYSVDNLPPASPSPFTATYSPGSTALSWGANSEPDFALYRLCRGTSADFVPGPGNLVATTTSLGLTDNVAQAYYYKLAAQDIHGNLSPFALVLPPGALGVGDQGPAVMFLAPAGPNPARGATAFRFGLPVRAHASLILFDANGRAIRTLVRGDVDAGEHLAAWDGRDDVGHAVADGLYFAQLSAAGETRTARVISMR